MDLLWYNKSIITLERGDLMPQIIPIRDLKNTSEISQMCHSSKEPIFITKNGYGDMVIMSMEAYEQAMYMNDIYIKLQTAERSVSDGELSDAFESLREIRKQYEV